MRRISRHRSNGTRSSGARKKGKGASGEVVSGGGRSHGCQNGVNGGQEVTSKKPKRGFCGQRLNTGQQKNSKKKKSKKKMTPKGLGRNARGGDVLESHVDRKKGGSDSPPGGKRIQQSNRKNKEIALDGRGMCKT